MLLSFGVVLSLLLSTMDDNLSKSNIYFLELLLARLYSSAKLFEFLLFFASAYFASLALKRVLVSSDSFSVYVPLILVLSEIVTKFIGTIVVLVNFLGFHQIKRDLLSVQSRDKIVI